MAVVGGIGLIALMVTIAGSQMAASKVSHCPDRTVSQAMQQDTATDHPPNGEPSGELLFTFRSFMQITSAFKQVDLNGQCAFYAPFPSWTVTNPQITEVDPTRVHRGGGTFLIVGSQLYPSIVSSVLLGGDPLPAPNVVPLDDSHVKVVVPSGAKVGLTPVQVNTFFNGSTLPSNSNVQVDIRP
jgi:hypothetical protein